MKTQQIKDMAKALATMRESAKTRALASVKAQPKDKVSLAPAPWDKKKAAKEDASNDKSDDGEGLDKVDTKATKKKFANRKDKDIDNDGDTDSSDEYLHKRRKAISKSVKESEVQEKAPKMTGDSVAIQRAKDKAHADAMGRHVKSGRAKSVKEASLDEASKEGTIKIIKTKDNMFQVQRMTKGKFVDQGKPHKSAKDAEKVRSSGQDTMQFEELEELTAAENKLIAQLYDSKGNLNALGKKMLAHGSKQKNESVEVAEVTIAKGTHTPNNGSPRGEGLSPNAKDQLKTANDTVDDEVDGPVVNKKSFDAMRASLKTAPKRNADKDTGDKVIVKGGK